MEASKSDVYAICKFTKDGKYCYLAHKVVKWMPPLNNNAIGAMGYGVIPGSKGLLQLDDLAGQEFITYCHGDEVDTILRKMEHLSVGSDILQTHLRPSIIQFAEEYARAQRVHA